MANFILDSFPGKLFSTHLVFLVFAIIGLVQLSVIYFITRSRKRIIVQGYDAKATVTDVIQARGDKGGTIYKPVFHFNTYLNQPVTVQSKIGSNPNYYPVGSEVEIFYDPDRPSRFVIKGDKRFRLAFIIIGLIGTIFFLIGSIGIAALFWITK